MDDIDRKLIALLRHDARLPIASLAAELQLSRATVRARIDRLVQNRVILGFTVNLGEDASANRIRAVMMIAVEGHRAEAIIKRLYGFLEIRALHTTNGRWDVVAEIETDTLVAFDKLLTTIRQLDAIASTETSILLSSRKR